MRDVLVWNWELTEMRGEKKDVSHILKSMRTTDKTACVSCQTAGGQCSRRVRCVCTEERKDWKVWGRISMCLHNSVRNPLSRSLCHSTGKQRRSTKREVQGKWDEKKREEKIGDQHIVEKRRSKKQCWQVTN